MTIRSVSSQPRDVLPTAVVVTAPFAPPMDMSATSFTTAQIVLGVKTFTTEEMYLGIDLGARVRISYAADVTQWMEGNVTAKLDRDLTINVLLTSGATSTWSNWIINIAGEKGQKGDIGVQGTPGDPGGPPGPAGPAGPQGIQGITGPGGATGPQGIPGVTGATGLTGTQGVQGPQGDPGPTGAKGDTGEVPEAPSDGFIYGRKNLTWIAVGGGIADAPSDGVRYVRLNNAWFNADTWYSKIVSPALSGNPTAPTPAPGDADQSIATTAFVADAIGTLKGTVSASFDTLGKLESGVNQNTTDITARAVIGGAPAAGQMVQWASPTQVVGVANSALPFAPRKNRLINSAMSIDQINGGGQVGGLTTAQYCIDGYIFAVNTGTYSSQRTSYSTPPVGMTSRWSLTLTASVAGVVTTGAYVWLAGRIEGLEIADLGWGTPNAKPILIRIGVKPPVAGTYHVVIQGGSGGTTCYVHPITFVAGDVGKYKVYYFLVPGPTIGSPWTVDTGTGLTVGFTLLAGSDFVAASADTWATSGQKIAGPGQSNGVATAVAWEFFEWAIYDGSGLSVNQPPSYEIEEIGMALARCLRRWCATVAYHAGWASHTGYFSSAAYLPVPMRASPTVTYAIQTAQGVAVFSSVGYLGGNAVYAEYVGATGGGNCLTRTILYCDARL